MGLLLYFIVTFANSISPLLKDRSKSFLLSDLEVLPTFLNDISHYFLKIPQVKQDACNVMWNYFVPK